MLLDSKIRSSGWTYTKVDLGANKQRRNTSRSKHETPIKTGDMSGIWDLIESNIGDVSNHNSECSPPGFD